MKLSTVGSVEKAARFRGFAPAGVEGSRQFSGLAGACHRASSEVVAARVACRLLRNDGIAGTMNRLKEELRRPELAARGRPANGTVTRIVVLGFTPVPRTGPAAASTTSPSVQDAFGFRRHSSRSSPVAAIDLVPRTGRRRCRASFLTALHHRST